MLGKHNHSYKNLAIYATLTSTSGADLSTGDAGPQTYKMLHFLRGSSGIDSVLLTEGPPPPIPPHVLMNFRGFPPGCGDSVADF
jgi:hypothetical protein